MRGEIRNCPICGCVIPRGKLFCRAHWFMVSPATRREVNATWREFKHAEKGQPKILALAAYRVAHEKAMAEALAAEQARRAA